VLSSYHCVKEDFSRSCSIELPILKTVQQGKSGVVPLVDLWTFGALFSNSMSLDSSSAPKSCFSLSDCNGPAPTAYQ
jgi:hypothetical protein